MSTPSVPRTVTGYACTLLVPLLALAALLAGWRLVSAAGWPAAVALVAGWCAVVGGWLRLRGWRGVTVHLLTWAGPVVLLAPLARLGWLSGDGFVLWAPVSVVLAVSLAMSAGHGVRPGPGPADASAEGRLPVS